jgi:2-methylcitrate dehydratase PrpD
MSALAHLQQESLHYPATKAIATFVTTAPIGRGVAEKAIPAIIDTLAVMIAGGAEPGVKALAGTFETFAGPTAVSSFWANSTFRFDDAVLLIGMASHVLDYDDVSMLAVCHPSAPILAALLGAAPWNGVAGRELLEAFVVGTEVLVRLGQAMGFRHYELGFHATATLGSVGAAAACARLMKLDERRTAHAIAIAASLSSGLRKNFGTMVKSLHVGIAAANGLKAARLAAAGIDGAIEAIEAEGFLHAFSGGETNTWPTNLVLGAPFAIAEPGFEQKRYPCCYMLHKIIEATLMLRQETGLNLAAVKSARVDMPQGGTKPLIHPYPRSGLNALFSAPYAVTASLADGRIDLKSFTDVAVLRPEIQARLHDVTVVEAQGVARQGSDVGSAPVTVTLTPIEGDNRSRTVVPSPGSAQDPLTAEQLKAKWIDCLQRGNSAITPASAESLFREGEALDSASDLGGWLGKLRAAVLRR